MPIIDQDNINATTYTNHLGQDGVQNGQIQFPSELIANASNPEEFDKIQSIIYDILCEFITEDIISWINKDNNKEKLKNNCSSSNNSRSINSDMEDNYKLNIMSFIKKKFVCKSVTTHISDASLRESKADINIDIELMCGTHLYIHIDAKGVTMKKIKGVYKEPPHRGGNTDDHKPGNYHLRDTQCDWNHTFLGKIDKKDVPFRGKISRNGVHMCFLFKHTYSTDKGLHGLEICALPHHTVLPIYVNDIQKVPKFKTKKALYEEFDNLPGGWPKDKKNIMTKPISELVKILNDLQTKCNIENTSMYVQIESLTKNRLFKAVQEARFCFNWTSNGKPYCFLNNGEESSKPRFKYFPIYLEPNQTEEI
jgi:hypothetical protein